MQRWAFIQIIIIIILLCSIIINNKRRRGQTTSFCHIVNKPWQWLRTHINKFYCVFTHFEGFSIEFKQKQKVVPFWPKVAVGPQTPPPQRPPPPKVPLFWTPPLTIYTKSLSLQTLQFQFSWSFYCKHSN